MTKKKLIVTTISALIIIILFSACGRTGKRYPNIIPFIEITSFAGADSTEAIDEANPDIYQQRIFWNAYDTDGVVRKYAYRVLDENENPIVTADHTFIDDDGWIYHYADGADINIPMDDPEANITVWTSDSYALINFPANVDGENVVVTSIFDVKCIDNRGGESEFARKYMSSDSEIPRVQILSTKGGIDGQIVGTGLTFAFDLWNLGQGVSDYPYYFEFKLEKTDTTNQPDGYGVWHSTQGTDDPKHFTVTNVQGDSPFTTYPSIIPNTEVGDVLQDSTKLFVIGYNLGGVATAIDSIIFGVKEGLNPGSIIYNGTEFGQVPMNGDFNDIFVYGQNHFTTLDDENTYGVEVEAFNTPEGVKYASPFWVNKDGEFSCLGSTDLRIFMHWGWHGEFGEPRQGLDPLINDNPRIGSRVGQVVDELSDVSYFSEIVYFDLRLDDEPYYYPAFAPNVDNIQIDDDGTEWLRVPYSHNIAQRTVITRDQILHNSDYLYGLHKFEVRVVDLQMEGDPTPAEMLFRIVETVPRDEKNDILIIDDDRPFAFAPEQEVDDFYSEIFANFDGTVDQIDRSEIVSSTFISALHIGRDALSATDLEPYKLVVYHCDIANESNFDKEYEVLNLYMRGGGNLLISAGSSLAAQSQLLADSFLPILRDYFDIPMETFINPDDDIFINPSVSYTQNFFLDKIRAVNNYTNDVYLQLPSFINLLNLKKGTGAVSYINEDYIGNGFIEPQNVIMTFGCKQYEPYVDSDGNGQWDEGEDYTDHNQNSEYDVWAWDGTEWEWDNEEDTDEYPTLDQFNSYNGQAIAIKNVTENNNCYLFGVPLSLMKTEEVKNMMDTIILELP